MSSSNRSRWTYNISLLCKLLCNIKCLRMAQRNKCVSNKCICVNCVVGDETSLHTTMFLCYCDQSINRSKRTVGDNCNEELSIHTQKFNRDGNWRFLWDNFCLQFIDGGWVVSVFLYCMHFKWFLLSFRGLVFALIIQIIWDNSIAFTIDHIFRSLHNWFPTECIPYFNVIWTLC